MNPSNITSAHASNSSGLVVVQSTFDIDTTWMNLTRVVDANPNLKVIGTVDHAKAAEAVGLDLAPTKLLVFGNPALGSPIMTANRTAGLDLPQKMAVWEADGTTYLAFNPVQYLSARHEIADNPSFPKMGAALAGIASKVTGTEVTSDGIDLGQLSGNASGLVLQETSSDFETAWTNLLAALDASPANVAFTVDHATNSGGTLGPTRLVVFGNPKLGTALMQESQTMAIDLPLKILVWEDAAGVHLAANNAAFLANRHNINPSSLEPVQVTTAKLLTSA